MKLLTRGEPEKPLKSHFKTRWAVGVGEPETKIGKGRLLELNWAMRLGNNFCEKSGDKYG